MIIPIYFYNSIIILLSIIFIGLGLFVLLKCKPKFTPLNNKKVEMLLNGTGFISIAFGVGVFLLLFCVSIEPGNQIEIFTDNHKQIQIQDSSEEKNIIVEYKEDGKISLPSDKYYYLGDIKYIESDEEKIVANTIEYHYFFRAEIKDNALMNVKTYTQGER